MANSKAYNLDPNVMLPTAQAGVAQSPADRSASLYTKMIARANGAGGAGYEIVDTTSLVGKVLWAQYCLSVDGTKSSTGNNALPNGSCVGERCAIINTTASNIPVGSIDGAFRGGLAAAYTHLGAIGVVASTTVTGDSALLEWDGTAWIVLWQTGCTLS